MSLTVDRLDHLVLTVSDIDATCDFYVRVLGMVVSRYGNGRVALNFGGQKINLHPQGREHEPNALHPTPGSGDLCLITRTPMAEVLTHLQGCAVTVEVGPVQRIGAHGPILSVYIRDPDGNLIEIANLLDQLPG